MPWATICWKSRIPAASIRLTLRFLFLLLQAEAHGQGFLLGLLLGLNGGFERRRQLDIAEQDAFHDETTLTEQADEMVEDLPGNRLAFAGVESVGGVRGGSFPDGRAEVGLDQYIGVPRPELLEDVGGLFRIEMVDERRIECHHQAFAGRNAGGFLDLLGADRELVVGLEGIDEVHSLRQSLAGDSAEEGQDPDRAGIDPGDRGKQKNHDQKADNTQSQKTQGSSAVHVYHAALRRIEDGHRTLP